MFRSGTLSTIIGAKVYKLKTITEVVDLIVHMRQSRDGLVETPEQLNYILKFLNQYDNLSLIDNDEENNTNVNSNRDRDGSIVDSYNNNNSNSDIVEESLTIVHMIFFILSLLLIFIIFKC